MSENSRLLQGPVRPASPWDWLVGNVRESLRKNGRASVRVDLLNDGTPNDNGQNFSPFCGKPLVEVTAEEETP